MFGSSFFDAQLRSRNIQMGYGREYILMSQTKIIDYIDKDFLTFSSKVSNEIALKQFKKTNLTEGYFVNKENYYLGKLKLTKILNTNGKSITFKEKKHMGTLC